MTTDLADGLFPHPAPAAADRDTDRWADLSADGVYRYLLGRRWDDGPLAGWVMLNPSTADHTVDDPTIRRCIGFAKSWGYAGILVGNVYALRATNPDELTRHPDPRGGDRNAQALAALTVDRDALVVAAWGARVPPDVAERTAEFLSCGHHQLRCLGHTHSGQPRHPLYVRGDTQLEDYRFEGER